MASAYADSVCPRAAAAQTRWTPGPVTVDPCFVPDEPTTSAGFVPAPRVNAGWLVCRRVEPGDAGALYDAVTVSAEHLRPWMPWAEGYTPELAQAFVEGNVARSGNPAVPEASYLACHSGGQLLGVCGLHARLGPGALEIGYWIDVRHTRRGVATLAAAALTELAMNTPGVQVAEIHHDRDNRASGAVPVRLGYELVATVDDEPAAPGEVGVELQWRMTRAAWRASAGARLLDRARTAAA